MTDQTACRPGTIATIGLPADMAVVSAIVAGIVRTRPGVRAVQHQDHLDVCAPAPEAHDPQNAPCVPAGRPGSVSEDSGTCGGSCGAARALRRDVRELTDALGEARGIAEDESRDRISLANRLTEAHAGLLIAVKGNIPLVKRAEKAEAKVARVQKIVPTLRKIWDGEGKDVGQVIDAVEELIGQALDGGTEVSG